jgi:hypothetical protein
MNLIHRRFWPRKANRKPKLHWFGQALTSLTCFPAALPLNSGPLISSTSYPISLSSEGGWPNAPNGFAFSIAVAEKRAFVVGGAGILVRFRHGLILLSSQCVFFFPGCAETPEACSRDHCSKPRHRDRDPKQSTLGRRHSFGCCNPPAPAKKRWSAGLKRTLRSNVETNYQRADR